jgi:hypothetical protein
MASAALVLAPLATAGDLLVEPLVLIGDAVPGVGLVTSINDLAINDLGQWAGAVNTDFPSSFENSCVLVDGAVYYREGAPVPGLPALGLNSWGWIHLDEVGALSTELFTFNLQQPFGNNAVVHWNGVEVLRNGSAMTDAPFPPNTFWQGFDDVRSNGFGQLLVQGVVNEGQTGTLREVLQLVFAAPSGQVVATQLLAYGGQSVLTAAGLFQSIETIYSGPHNTAFTSNGRSFCLVNVTGPLEYEVSALLDGSPVAQEGGPSPVAGRLWSDLAFAPLDVNTSGDWVLQGRLHGDPATDLLLVKNGQKFAQSGDPVPGVPGATILNFSQTGPIYVDDDGDVVWQAAWLDGGGLRNGWFLNHEPLLVEGLTQVAGATLVDLWAFQDGFEFAPRGGWFAFRGTLSDGRSGLWRGRFDAAVEVLPGCFGNVPVLAAPGGDPVLGQSFPLAMSGSPFVPSLAAVYFAAAPILPGSPCGVPLAGAGELLLPVVPPPVAIPLPLFSGAPTSLAVPVPADPALAGVELFAQGLFTDALFGSFAPFRLTNGLRLCLGS